MTKKKPMKLLLVEDDHVEWEKFEDYVKTKKDIEFVGMTSSSEEGLEMVKTKKPEAVILDLQLTQGSGSGIHFLDRLNRMDLEFRPVVVVTSSNQSQIVKNLIEELGIDWYFCKMQTDYNVDFVLDTLFLLRNHIVYKNSPAPSGRSLIESPEARRERIYSRIDSELNAIGVRNRYKGYAYLREGIYLQINTKYGSGSPIEQVAVLYGHAYNTISAGMHTSIKNAWSNTPPELIRDNYKARIRNKEKIPTPSEFIQYYTDKIKKTI
ncbi:MAG: response regulator [Lachnospiraceae bacterium]|nr:response regulator [Lachnospiraceae bacterium]